jgi:ribosomal protein S12 methylthiotransferase
MSKKVFISTLGCSKNDVDSDVLKGQIQDNKMQIVDSAEESDVVIVNTCGFIGDAKEESVDTVLEAIEQKKSGGQEVYVAGCLSARYKDQLKDEIPEIDQIFGTEAFDKIVKTLDPNAKTSVRTYFQHRANSSLSHYAYIKISEGCDHKCSFCAIPSMRGKHRSRGIESIIDEAQILADRGVKEIILIAQDSTYYGRDIYGKPSLGKLLQELEKIENIAWIRVMYLYPLSFPKDIIPIMKNSKKICRYVDIPVQHISDNMLEKMNRGTKKDYTFKVLDEIRREIPDITLRTTLITGHPGETEKDHQEALEFIEKYKFNRLGVFTYSDEDGTKSAELEGKVEMSEMISRMEEILQIQESVSYDLNHGKIGKTEEIIIDEFDAENNQFIGRTKADAPEIDNIVLVDFDEKIKIGEIFQAKIYDAGEFELFAKII